VHVEDDYAHCRVDAGGCAVVCAYHVDAAPEWAVCAECGLGGEGIDEDSDHRHRHTPCAEIAGVNR